jgi:hypothetical protein
VRARLAGGFLAATLVAALVIPGAALLPGAALAQGPSNPLAPGLPQPTVSVPTTSTPLVTPTTSSSTSGGGLSSSSAIAIALGAVIVLSGISFFIWRDARRRAPVRHAHADAAGGSRAGSKRPIKPRKLSPAERRRRKRGRAR